MPTGHAATTSEWSTILLPTKVQLILEVKRYIQHGGQGDKPLLKLVMTTNYDTIWPWADSRFAPSQWETALLCNDVSLWLSASLESALWPQWVNTLRPRQNGRHFADAIFMCIFLNENVWIPIEISLKFVPNGPINNIPSLVQIMV